MNIAKKLSELNIQLPAAPDPVGAYVAFKKVGNMLFISGQLPIASDGKIIKGKIGKMRTYVEQNSSGILIQVFEEWYHIPPPPSRSSK